MRSVIDADIGLTGVILSREDSLVLADELEELGMPFSADGFRSEHWLFMCEEFPLHTTLLGLYASRGSKFAARVLSEHFGHGL